MRRREKLKKNPAYALESQVRQGAKLLHAFTGMKNLKVKRLTLPKTPPTVAQVGKVRAIIYDTVRDGKHETYIHKFKVSSRPLFAVSPDGKQLFMLGGAYNFTDRGIVDKT